MRGAWTIAAALVVGALLTASARAGVYNTAEPWPRPGNFSQFQIDLANYRSAAVDLPNRVAVAVWSVTAGASPTPGLPPSLAASLVAQRDLGPAEQSIGMRYVRRAAALEAEDARGMLSPEGRINLGAYYVRLGNYRKAIQVLEAKAQESRDFMLRANLATAYELAGVPERALRYQELALSSWPAMYAGWDGMQLNFYRKAEQYHLTLLQSRHEEALRPPSRGGLRLDPLFPRVRFVGPSGEYEVGTIAPAQWAEVPADAISVVMQLLLWMPFDDRLHWLLGELLNASGDVVGAAAILKPVLYKPQDPTKWDTGAPPELREHYRLLAEAARAKESYVQAQLPPLGDPYLNLKLLCAVAPRGVGLGAGDLAREAVWPGVVLETEARARQAQKDNRGATGEATAATAATTAAGPSSPAWMPDWRQLAVGFVAGAAVAALLGLQLRQGRRQKG
jgi:tetratricopeptide (TPR) repeat protein